MQVAKEKEHAEIWYAPASDGLLVDTMQREPTDAGMVEKYHGLIWTPGGVGRRGDGATGRTPWTQTSHPLSPGLVCSPVPESLAPSIAISSPSSSAAVVPVLEHRRRRCSLQTGWICQKSLAANGHEKRKRSPKSRTTSPARRAPGKRTFPPWTGSFHHGEVADLAPRTPDPVSGFPDKAPSSSPLLR